MARGYIKVEIMPGRIDSERFTVSDILLLLNVIRQIRWQIRCNKKAPSMDATVDTSHEFFASFSNVFTNYSSLLTTLEVTTCSGSPLRVHRFLSVNDPSFYSSEECKNECCLNLRCLCQSARMKETFIRFFVLTLLTSIDALITTHQLMVCTIPMHILLLQSYCALLKRSALNIVTHSEACNSIHRRTYITCFDHHLC